MKSPTEMAKRYTFKDDVMVGKMRPFFEKYEGHIFEIDHVMDPMEDPTGGHVWLKCIDDPEFIVNKYIHLFDLECLNPENSFDTYGIGI